MINNIYSIYYVSINRATFHFFMKDGWKLDKCILMTSYGSVAHILMLITWYRNKYEDSLRAIFGVL